MIRSINRGATAALIAVGALAVFSLPRDGVQDAAAASRPASRGPLVVLTGNEHGFIRPCGCSKPALGGVHRRAHAIEELRKADPKLDAVSLGEFISESGRQQEIKFETFLLSLAEMQYAAFVPGVGELRLGTKFITDSKAMVPFPFVLANATWDGAPLVGSVRLGDGALIGLVGDVPPELGVKTTPATEALVRELGVVKDAAWSIVAYNGPVADLAALGKVVPEARRKSVTFAVPGVADAPVQLEPVLGMRVVCCGMKGRSLALVRPTAERFFESLLLEESRPGLPSVSALLEGYRTTVREEGLAKNVGRVNSALKYVGDKKCAECHEGAIKTLATTPHQRAMKSLEATNDHHDPECVKCHVTGWATESGYVDPVTTPTMMNVNCETCHGPGSLHAQTLAPTAPGKVDANTCVRCHDPDNSPHFEFKTYWPKIEHK